MDVARFQRLRLPFTLGLGAAYLGLLVWQYTHDGVPGHRFLMRKDMPYFSNWWGAFVLPTLAWFLTGRLAARLQRIGDGAEAVPAAFRAALLAFGGALLYGALLAFAFETDHTEVSSTLFQSLPVLALLLPVFRAEYVLGYILGLTLTFGAVLPTIIASAVALMSLVLHLTVRRGFIWMMARVVPDRPRS